MKKLIFLFILSTVGIYAQDAQLKKADKYFATASYTESAELYATIIKEGNTDQQILKKAADSYYFISDFTKAEPLYQKLVTTYKEGLDDKYFFRYAQTLKALNKTSESEKWMRIYQKDIPETVYKANLDKLESIKKEGDKFEIKNIATNSTFSDFGPAFYQNSLVFSSPSKDNPLAKKYKWTNQPYLDLYIAPIENNEVANNAVPFSQTLNSNLHEADVTFSKDGKTIYFTRNISVDGKRKKDKNKITNLGIYKADLVDGVWGNIQPLSINSKTYSTMHPSLNQENNRLYFASDMPGSIGSVDIFYVTIDENGTLGKPVNLGPEINTKTREQFPFMAENNVLYFSSDGHAGFGLLDVFKSELKDNTFTKPINVGLPVNTNADDFSFIVDEKNKKGFFASNRANGKGDDDIYSFSQLIPVEPKEEFTVQGLIQDSETNVLVKDAVITLFDENGNKIKEMMVNETGSFGFDLDKLGTFKITASHPDYITAEKTFTILDDGKKTHQQNIAMKRIPKTFLEELIAEQGQPKVLTDNGVLMFDLPGILFDYDKSNIRPDAQLQLNKLIDKLKRYPQIKIEIGAHTDIRGGDEYNQKLSQDRASSTKKYLVEKGISTDRITGIGYGENRPKVNCNDHECTEAEHQINRRSEFLIIVK